MLASILLLSPYILNVLASETVFSVNDDIFAYPQYEISFPPAYVVEHEAAHALATKPDPSSNIIDHERMILHGRPYLCSIPRVTPLNITKERPSEHEKQKELGEAADRGWQLLQDMEGKQCLYYSAGWWSYSFCHNSHVKQFHALPPGTNGARYWPPKEDPTAPSYVLGKFGEKTLDGPKQSTELQTKADTTYLVRRLQGGTLCDLTGKDRKVEVQFHCHSQTTDRIGWIKEVATCTYLMIIYTPRLCNDVAFQAPRDSQAHTISCQEILTEAEAEVVALKPHSPSLPANPEADAVEQPLLVGTIRVGEMRHVGHDGRKIEKGRIVMTAEEKAEVIMVQKDGQIQSLSTPDLKKLGLKPEDLESFKKEIQEVAGNKDWRIERIADEGSKVQLRAIFADDDAAKPDARSDKLPDTSEDQEEQEHKEDTQRSQQ